MFKSIIETSIVFNIIINVSYSIIISFNKDLGSNIVNRGKKANTKVFLPHARWQGWIYAVCPYQNLKIFSDHMRI